MIGTNAFKAVDPPPSSNAPVFSPVEPAEPGRPRVVVISAVLATMYVGHVAWILIFTSPLSWFCCTCPPLDTYVWILAAVLCTGFLLWQARGTRKRVRVQCLVLAGLLGIFIGDVLSGGNYRWLDFALERELSSCGGAEALGRWADQYLSEPDVISGTRSMMLSDDKTLPDNVRRLAKRNRAFIANEANPLAWINFGSQGPEQGWGIAAGHPTLQPTDFGSAINQGWIRQVGPGMFFYAWGFNFKHS